MGVLQGDPLFTMRATRDIVYPEQQQGGKDIDSPSMEGPTTTAAEVRGAYDAMGFDSKMGQKGFEEALSMMLGPVSGVYTGFRMGLGAIASTMESFEDGMLGDAFGTREREDARDRAERTGYSREQTAAGADVDADIGGYTGLDPGLGSSGYGLDPGLADMDPYGSYGLEEAPASTTATTRGAYSGTLGDMSFGGNDSSSGDTSGSEGHGARGGGDEGTSEPGGIGGY